jgi:6-phosphogluconolactonase (cycloisomerase 2 family)
MFRKLNRLSAPSGVLALLPIVFFLGCSSNQKSSTSPPPSSGSGGGGSGGGGGTGGNGGSASPGPTISAYVYVSNSPSGNYQYQISAYSADANGQLTPLAGSPFNDNVVGINAYGDYLVGETVEQISSTGAISNNYIDAFKIGSDGALTPASQTDVNQTVNKCAEGSGIFFDRTGQTLYHVETRIDCANNGVASFSIDQTSGNLAYLGNVVAGRYLSGQVAVSGNNQFAYSALSECMYPAFSAFARASNGLLSLNKSFQRPSPPAPPPGAPPTGFVTGYVPGLSATDSTNHIVFAELPCFGQGGPTQTQLATYTIDASGNLSTTDTYATMPAAPILTTKNGELLISPSDKFLAVADTGGLQIYHFNGANSVTTFTDVLTTDNISQIAWDKEDHLYAITGNVATTPAGGFKNASKLYVFTVTDKSVTQAPGSPYTIAFPAGLVVQSK